MEVFMDNSKPETSGDVRRIRRVVAFLGLFLILLGQFLIYSTPLNDRVIFPPQSWLSLLGVALFLIGQAIPSNKWTERLSARLGVSPRLAWIGVALALSALATLGAELFQISTRSNYIPILTVWFLGAIAYVTAFFNGEPLQFDLRAWWTRYRNEVLTVLGLIVLAAAARFYMLGEIPRVLDGDEGRVGLAAQTTVLGELANPFALWDNFGALYLQAINLSLKFFGPTPFGLRLVPALGGILAVPAVYLFARQIGGRQVAFIAAFLIAVSHTHINFSRIASVAYIHGTWLVPFELYFLLSGLEKRQAWRTALSGVILAMHFSVYLTAQVVTAMILVYMLICAVFLRAWFRDLWRQVLAFWGGLLITLLPELVYVIRTPEQFLNRLAQDGTFNTGWLADTMAATGHSAVQVLGERVIHAFLALIYYPALDFYGSPTPMLSMISASMFLLGLGLSLWWTRSPRYLLLNGNFWAATLAVGIFAVPPSADSYRMLMALPAALIMAAVGLNHVFEYLGLGWEKARGAYVASVGAVLASLLIFNLWTYYGDFAGQCRYGDNLAGRFASYLGKYARSVTSESDIYLLSNNIYVYGSHASTDFLSQRRTIINVPEPLDAHQFVSGETIIASPDRITELLDWARAHPGGELRYQYDCQRTILLAYQVP